MLYLYNLGIKAYTLLIHAAQFFNPKAKLWVKGRTGLFERIRKEVEPGKSCVWFHFASLGEFEQGRPVLEAFRRYQPEEKILITFYSPSGYEQRKNYPLADHIFYLPADTIKNARRFIDLINPKMAIFTKYEFWHNYFRTLSANRIPLYVISATFRKKQVYFRWYGNFNRRTLGFVTTFFVQDAFSMELLKMLGLSNCIVSGDTRFDRVSENAASPKDFPTVAQFSRGANVMVAGSTWPEDERILAELVKDQPSWKFIFAPHEISAEKLHQLEYRLPEGSFQRYSSAEKEFNHAARVLIIDNIGMLSSLYRYARIAYIGGGFGTGIHNTLEAAAFGIPVIFGPNYQKFLEARALVRNGGGISIDELDGLRMEFKKLQYDKIISKAGKAAGEYVANNKGATQKIIDHIYPGSKSAKAALH